MKKLAVILPLLAVAAPLRAQTAAAAAPAAAQPRRPLPNDSLALARKYAVWFLSSQADSMLAHGAPADRTPENKQQVLDQMAQVASRVGSETSVVEERWVRRNGQRQYWRVSRFSDFADEPIMLRLVIMPDGSLGGFGINPLSRVPPIDPEP